MTRVTLDVCLSAPSSPTAWRGSPMRSGAHHPLLRGPGPIDPLDVFGMPNWLPRIADSRRGRRSASSPRCGRAERAPPGAGHVGRRGAARPPHPAPASAGPRDRPRLSDLEVQGQHRHLHRRPATRPPPMPDLDALLPVAGRLARGRRSRPRSDAAFAGSPAPGLRPCPAPRRPGGGDAPLPAGAVHEPQALAEDRIGPDQDPARLAGDGRPLRAAPPPPAVGRARRLHPERFLPENRARIDRYAYLPFGRGRGSASARAFR